MGEGAELRLRAACKPYPAQWFVGELRPWEEVRAKEICARCPVVAECRALADEVETRDPETRHAAWDWQGVWAGETAGERRVRRGAVGRVGYYRPRVRRAKNGNVRHGTKTMYGDYGCRCFDCQEANRLVCADWRKRNPGGAKPKVKVFPHGRVGGYRQGCRCEPCSKAASQARKEYKAVRKAKEMKSVLIQCVVCHKQRLVSDGRSARGKYCGDNCRLAARRARAAA